VPYLSFFLTRSIVISQQEASITSCCCSVVAVCRCLYCSSYLLFHKRCSSVYSLTASLVLVSFKSHKLPSTTQHSRIMGMNAKLVNTWLEAASVFSCGLVAGSTVYIQYVEIPSRKNEPLSYQLMNWHCIFPKASSYLKPFGMAINALVGCTMARTGKKMWLIPCALFGMMAPFTMFGIASTNDELKALERGKETDEKAATDLVELWGKLHNVRTVMSILGFVGAIAAMASD